MRAVVITGAGGSEVVKVAGEVVAVGDRGAARGKLGKVLVRFP